MVANDFKINVLPVSRKLLLFATRFLNDEEKARDAVQDVFLKLWQKRNDLAEIENIEAFAMTMTKNRCLDLIKSERFVQMDAQTERKLKEQSVDYQRSYDYSESANQIKKLISELPDLQKRVMQMRDIDELSYEEISEITDLNLNAVRVNLSRARKKVRDEYLKLNADGYQKDRISSESLF